MAGFLSLHFLLAGIYSFAPYAKRKSTFYAFTWIYPFFHQNWSLFAPPVTENFNLYVRYRTLEGEKEWNDLFYKINSCHQKNRFGGRESLLLSLSNSLRYYSTTANPVSRIETDEETNLNFKVLKKVVKGCLENKEGANVSELEILIGIVPQKEQPHYHYYRSE